MTLTNTRIKQYGESLYRKLAREGRLSPDACADAYEMFMRRMRRYRSQHPATERVPPMFVKKCERWIRTDLLRRKRNARVNATLEVEMAKRVLPLPDGGRHTGNTGLFQKLEGFFTRWAGESPKAAEYARIFLLYNAWHLSPRRVRLFAPLVGGKKSAFVKAVKAVKKHVAEHSAAGALRDLQAAQYWYSRSVWTDLRAEEETGERHAMIRARRADYAGKQRRALERLARVTYRPTLQALAGIAGVSAERVR